MRKIALLAAALIGAASFFLMYQYQDAFEKRVSGGEKIAIIVAASNLELGDILTEDSLAVREIPSSYLEDRHILASDVGKAIGIRTTMGLKSNEAILWTDLAVASEEGRILSGLVRSGMRAVTVSIQGGGNLGGLLRAGDRIDLLFSTTRQENKLVLPLLQNVLVLAVGRQMGGNESILDIVRGASDLTLSVTVSQAQSLTLAQAEGTLTASLRNPNDIVVNADLQPLSMEGFAAATGTVVVKSGKDKDKERSVKTRVSQGTRGIEHVR